jgi:hypothetical protein
MTPTLEERRAAMAPLKEKILSCGLRPRLQLSLLRAALGERHALPLVQVLSKNESEPTAAPGLCVDGCGGRIQPTPFGF